MPTRVNKHIFRPRVATAAAAVIEMLEPRTLLAAQAYDWNNVTIKGTGFSDGIIFSPAQQGLAYMNTDMGGAYRFDTSVNKWVPLTDWITNNDPQWGIKYNGVETIAADPTDASRVYAGLGTYMGGNGAILRSSDQGRTWLRTNVPFGMDGNGSGRNSGQRMLVDPNSPNILFYGTRNSGIWKSSDYGATWNRLTGYSFTTDASGVAQNTGTDWLLIDKTSGTPGSPSQVIYAGSATAGDGKIWRSSDGGTTWTPIAGQPTGNTLYTVRGALTPDGGTLYLTYGVGGVGISPQGQSNGYVYKVTNPKNATPTWTALTIDSPHGQGGWSGITIDPNNPGNLFVTTLDRWWPGDEIYRSTNGGASWTPLNAQANRDNSSSAWASSVGLHWLGDIQIDPFNANDVMFTTGFGVFRSSNAMAATPTWAFFDDGFDQSAVSELVSPNTGTVNLFSAIGDRDGFRHADFAVSPARLGQSQGLATGTNTDIDVAWNDANYIVRATYTSPYVQYSNDNGVTWAWMSSTGVTATTGGDNLAISADGTKVVWEQGGTARVIYATRSGSTWSSWSAPASNQPADGSKVVADLASPTTFYAYAGTTLSRSTDGGANWTVMTSSAPGSGQAIRAVPGNAGHLLLSTGGGGLWRSTNGGSTWTRINSSAVTEAYELGLGMAAPGQSYPAMFVMGAVNGISGFFRSDDQGATWTMISDLAHEYGDVVTIQGDPRVYGRLYVGTNGRGILYADIHTPQTNLPGGWSTQDIGSVGSAGAAGSPAAGTWELTGGGAGIAGTADTFRFAYTTLSGDGTITAKVMGVPNASPANNNALAGVMIRNDLTAGSAQALMAMTPGSINGAVFDYRSTTGGSIGSANATTGVWNPYWVRLTRSGSTFTAYRSADGTTWTQVGAAQTIAMNSTVYVGLATTASDNNQVNTSNFQNVSVAGVSDPPPTVGTPASASPSTVVGTTTSLSALGADNNGEAALTYTWSATGPGAVTYSANGTNAAKNSVATFSKAGAYSFTVTIRDAGGSTVTSNVNVTVIRTLTSVGVTPATATVNTNATRQFTATAYDQFAQSMASQPTFTWSIASGAGAVNPSGLYTAPASAGSATIRATSAGVSGTASITVVATGIPSAPSGLTATAASSGQVNLTWNDTANNETGFIIDRATNASFTAGLVSVSIGANVTSRSITGLSPGVYFFRVRATNAAGDSANSNTASAKAWVTYQAEAATRGGGVTIDTNHAGYTGSGFANFPKSGGYLDWTVSTAAAGTYSLGFRYALASGTRNVQLTVNGVAISGGLTFTSSNSWSSWVTVNLPVNLAAGANTIRLMSTGQDSGNIDSLSVTPV